MKFKVFLNYLFKYYKEILLKEMKFNVIVKGGSSKKFLTGFIKMIYN